MRHHLKATAGLSTVVRSAAVCVTLVLAGCSNSDAAPKTAGAQGSGQTAAAPPIPGPFPEPPIPAAPMTIQQELASVLFNVCLPSSRGGSPLTAGTPIMKALGNPEITTNAETGETMSTFTTPRGLTVYVVPGSGHCEVSSSGLDLPDDIDLFTALDPIVQGWTPLGDGVLGSPDYRFSIVESVRYRSGEFNRFNLPPAGVKAHFDRIAANDALPISTQLKQAIGVCPRFLAIVKADDGVPEANGFPELSEVGGWSYVGGTWSLETNAGSLEAVDGHCEIMTNWDSGNAEATRAALARLQAAKAGLSDSGSGWRAAGTDAWISPEGTRVAYTQEEGVARFLVTPKA